MKKTLLALSLLALLAGCTSNPAPAPRAAVEPTFSAGDSLGKSLHRADQANAKSLAAHPN